MEYITYLEIYFLMNFIERAKEKKIEVIYTRLLDRYHTLDKRILFIEEISRGLDNLLINI